jgi:hypothetical protein
MSLRHVFRGYVRGEVFGFSRLLAATMVYFLVFAILNGLSRYAYENIQTFPWPTFFPISYMSFRIPSLSELALAVALVLLFPSIIRFIEIREYGMLAVISAGLFLALGTTMVQGWDNGFAVPIAGDCNIAGCIITEYNGYQYYHDRDQIVSIGHFLSHYHEVFSSLGGHTRNHPPGALFTVSLLARLALSPHAIGISIAFIAISLTALFLFQILKLLLADVEVSRRAVFIFLLIPSTQIYYVATIDALIAAFTLGFLYFFLRPQDNWTTYLGLIVFGFIASFLNFTFVLSFLVAIGYDLIVRHNLKRSLIAGAGIGLGYTLIVSLSGYNYVTAFQMAVANENAYGNPITHGLVPYLFTRIESVFDILMYFGPILCMLILLGVGIRNQFPPKLWWLTLLTTLVFFLTLVAGFYRTGETSRSNVFMWVFFLLPAFAYLQAYRPTDRQWHRLYWFLFGQTLLMQLFGFYFY